MEISPEINDDDSTSNDAGHIEQRLDNEPKLAVKENQAVNKLRWLVFSALIITGLAVSAGVYSYARKDESDDFKNHFTAHALKVVDSFNAQMSRKLAIMDGFSKSITTFAQESNLQFPSVTLPNFEIRGMSLRQQIGALRVDWFPLVTDDNKLEWERYAMQAQDWLMPAAKRERTFRLAQDERFGFEDEGGIPGVDVAIPTDELETTEDSSSLVLGTSTDSFSPVIYGKPNGAYEVEKEGPYLILWQFSPVTPTRGSLNFNLLTARSGPTFRAVLESSRAVLGNALALQDPEDPASGTHAKIYAKSLSIGQYRHSLDDLAGEPSSNLVYPVFTSFSENRTFAGVIRAALYWRDYFVDLLPENIHGLICVIENTQNQTFTYRIDGPDVTFLGPGDRHNPSFDEYEIKDFVTSTLERNQGPAATAFQQAEFDGEFCSYTLRLYPSDDMRDIYITLNPLLFAFLVGFSFIVPSAIFFVYNQFVERRQEVVMDRAVATGNIVSSLFPEDVANRLMEENKQKRKNQSFLSQFDGISDPSGQVVKASKPIAEKFEESTIMFGDLAGFTAWSSSRTADQVFVLLETLYEAFDQLAARRNVFKVETIGDCYVAVTGVPTPQPDHAVIMAKFARDCLDHFPELTHKLKDEVGDDTSDLKLRIGLHTGPVTAGVLRGQKSRFQLFGDSMNTSSRMETTGIPGRIHASKATADALISKGKSNWVVPREELIEAKGKGEMQTFWVLGNSTTSSVATSI